MFVFRTLVGALDYEVLNLVLQFSRVLLLGDIWVIKAFLEIYLIIPNHSSLIITDIFILYPLVSSPFFAFRFFLKNLKTHHPQSPMTRMTRMTTRAITCQP